MILSIVKYTIAFVMGAIIMASNPDLYEKAHQFFSMADEVVQDVTGKNDKDVE